MPVELVNNTGLVNIENLETNGQLVDLNTNLNQADRGEHNRACYAILADLAKSVESTVTVNLQLQDVGLLMVRQQALTMANNYPSDVGGGNAIINIPDHIKADVLILLDTTGSMQMELDSMIAAVKELLAKLPTNQPLTDASPYPEAQKVSTE